MSAPAECACDGSGWYLLRVPYGHPDWGKLQRCMCGRTLDGSRASSRLGDELGGLAHCTFETFDLGRPLAPMYQVGNRYYHDLSRVPMERRYLAVIISVAVQETTLINARDDARAYASAPDGWLCLHGAVGAGKSHLAAAIAHVRVRAGASVRYRSVPGMLDAIKAGFADHTSDAIFDDLLTCDLLILDDLGAEHLSGWAYERLFRLLNERLAKPTIITSNLHPDDLGESVEGDAQRLADRISGAARRIWLPISSYRRLAREVAL